MNILIVFDHDKEGSFCLENALSHCINTSEFINIYIKNLRKNCEVEKTAWFSHLKSNYPSRIDIFKKKDRNKIDILCSLTHKTSFNFIKKNNINKIGLFQNSKILATDFVSPFLLMKSTPNKLNRENLYSLIINGQVRNELTTNELEIKNIKNNFCETCNEVIYMKDNSFNIFANEYFQIQNQIIRNNLQINLNNEIFITKSLGGLTYFKKVNSYNLLEEIIHLSMLFAISNIDYTLEDTRVDQETLAIFIQIVESAHESANFIKTFCLNKNHEKVNESINLTYKILKKYRVFHPILEYFLTLNITTDNTDENYLLNLESNADMLILILKTVYHLSNQKIEKKNYNLAQNN